MHKGRLEAYTDAVIAIIITIMVLELKVPLGHHWSDLIDLLPIFSGYLLSFIYIAIYRNNHHHLFQAVEHVSGRVLRSNNILLLFLSLIPFATSWMTESNFAMVPVMLYGIMLLLCAFGYTFVVKSLLRLHDSDSALAKAIGEDGKGNISLVLYISGIILAFFYPLLATIIYAIVAIIRLLPDTRIEKQLNLNENSIK